MRHSAIDGRLEQKLRAASIAVFDIHTGPREHATRARHQRESMASRRNAHLHFRPGGSLPPSVELDERIGRNREDSQRDDADSGTQRLEALACEIVNERMSRLVIDESNEELLRFLPAADLSQRVGEVHVQAIVRFDGACALEERDGTPMVARGRGGDPFSQQLRSALVGRALACG